MSRRRYYRGHAGQVWVTYGSRFSPQGKVHRADCRFADQGHGRWVKEQDEVDASIPDCKLCGGRYED